MLVSLSEQRAYVYRNGIEIGRARIAVTNPSVPIGTHTFILQEGAGAASLGVVPDPRSLPWLGVQTQGHADDAGRAMRPEAVAAISVPAPFMRALSLMIAPGTTFFVTEAPILAANLHTDFTVLTNDAPESQAN